MSGLFAQVGWANETTTIPVSTSGTSAAASPGGHPYVNTLGFGSAHGLQAGNVIVLSGYTASAWNGTWIVATVPSATSLTFLSTGSLGSLTVHGTITGSTYGTYATPSRFDTFLKESMQLKSGRIDSEGVGSNRRIQSSTRFVVDRQGAAGGLSLEIGSKGFGFWLKHLIGPVTTSGPTDSAYTHAAAFPTTLPGMLGVSFTLQGTVVPAGGFEMVKTYVGCKVTGWQLNFAKGKLLTIDLMIDAYDEKLNVTKATASYPASPEMLSFAGGAITLGGVTCDVIDSGSIKVDLGYDVDRRFARGNTLHKEPAESGFRTVTIDLQGEFDSVVTAYNRYAAAAAADTLAEVVLAFTGKVLIGASTYPSLTFTLASGRFDGETPGTDGPGLPQQKMTITGRSELTASYVTTDSTP